MITIDSVRIALRHPQPWTAMDELVRAEQSAGRKVREIHDELRALVEPVRTIDNPPEDADDAMMDTLDALAGNCRFEDRYTDPPNTSLPIEEEIAKLPRWAKVAFAARCARRVLPVAYNGWPAINSHLAQSFVDCTIYAEKVAEYAERLPEYEPIDVALEAIVHAEHVANLPADLVRACSCIGSAAVYAHKLDEANTNYNNFSGAVRDAVAAASDYTDITDLAHRDYEVLVREAARPEQHDERGYPPEVFGPLWPDGPPKCWPAEPNPPQHSDIALQVVSHDGLDERVVEDEVVNLFNAMNRYHIARGGQPLSLEDLQPLISALVPAGV